MKVLPLIWKFLKKYKLHVVTPGQFHTVMDYMGMVTGHKFRGSLYADIILEAGLITSGCPNCVLGGKAYAKALFCLKRSVRRWSGYCEEMEMFEQEDSVHVDNLVAFLSSTCSSPTA